MRLWIRMALVMAVVAIIPLVLMGIRAIQISTEESVRSSREIVLRDADAFATFVDTWMADQAQAVAGLMQILPVEGQSKDLQEALQKSIYLAVPTVVTVVLVDEDGVPLVPPLFLTEPGALGSTTEGRGAGSEVRASELIERVPLTEALATRSHLASAVVGHPYLPPGGTSVSVPVGATGPFGEPLVLGAEVSLEVVEALLREQASATHSVALLTSAGEDVIGGQHELIDAQRLQPLLTTRSNISYALADGREVRGAVAPIPRLGWSVAVVEPAEVAERAALGIRTRTTWVLLAAVALALAFGAVLARTVSEPVARLREVALAVAEGEYGRRAPVYRGDEIGELAEAFNHMSVRLKENEDALVAQQGEIEAFNRDLQERVEARTRELRETQQRLVRSGQLAAVAEVGAGLAHELNNPLAAILGLTQVLRQSYRGTPEDKSLERIEGQAERCRQVVSAMLQLTAGEVDPVQAVVIDLRVILRDVLELVKGSFRQRGVTLQLQEPDAALLVRIHPIYGSRILAQIFSSVRAGLEEGAILRVSAGMVGREVAIDLDPDRPVAIGSARDDWMASGMALWVARHLLDQVGGRLEEPLAPQTRWRVLLPGA
ncbi:MAG: HAMP domain-containing protein [Deltaproteobacteria bacterium]|nr:HAMP domain-containing protein [Deltaproteobacteria bacterium]MBW2254005.1 HAMP domain-containing protein [Deltaproteobacteria bacterium]